MEEKRKIIMDVDTGTDDAVALIMTMLDKHFDLLGICSVNGNVEVNCTTRNSLRVVELCGKQGQVKVYRGCDLPLTCTLMPWTPQSTGICTKDFHRLPLPKREGAFIPGAPVMHADNLDLPFPTIHEEKDSAVVWMINTLLAAEDGEITLIPVGPLTNVATAMRADPRICKKIREIVIMGGGHLVNNFSPAAEFNIWADPEAMEIVLQSGCKITMVPLDATHAAYITMDQAKKIRALGTQKAEFIADIIEHRIQVYGTSDVDMNEIQGAPVHDALAVCAVLHPEVLRDVLHCNCHVDISGGYAYGQTIVDRRLQRNPEPQNCYFALSADRELFFNWMYDNLKKDKESGNE